MQQIMNTKNTSQNATDYEN